jgi:sugar lactone lactonase YvrE
MINIFMKKFFISVGLFIVAFCTSPRPAMSQNVGITGNGAMPEASALLDIKSADKGILLPRMTAGQRSAILNPAKGLLVFQTDGSAGFYYYNGQAWTSLADGAPVNDSGVSYSYGTVSVFAGSSRGYENGPVATAKFIAPFGMAMDRAGTMYIADPHRIRKITAEGNVFLVAGSGFDGSINGPGSDATFTNPSGIAADAAGNLYVTDTDNNLIRKITPAGIVTTIAGRGPATWQDGPGNMATFFLPMGIAVDASGNLYIGDTFNNCIRKITPDGLVSTLAGTNVGGFADGTLATAAFARPVGLTLDAAGNIYVADMNNHRIRKITVAGVVTTFAGTGVAGAVDGTTTTATFNAPKAITIDVEGNFYVADAGNHIIRKITPGGIVSTLAGAGTAGNANGVSAAAYFNDPSGLVADTMGNLYVADAGNHTIRKIILR